jgi:hypothetical protein
VAVHHQGRAGWCFVIPFTGMAASGLVLAVLYQVIEQFGTAIPYLEPWLESGTPRPQPLREGFGDGVLWRGGGLRCWAAVRQHKKTANFTLSPGTTGDSFTAAIGSRSHSGLGHHATYTAPKACMYSMFWACR